MGEREFEESALATAVRGGMVEQAEAVAGLQVSTPGEHFQVRWDEGGSASALGQLAFFAEFLEVSGLFERWVESCPMSYSSPNAPSVRDVLGTWLLSILDGQRRYALVTGLRRDAVAPQILGMTKIISDESLRRALAHLAPTTGELAHGLAPGGGDAALGIGQYRGHSRNGGFRYHGPATACNGRYHTTREECPGALS